MYRPPQYTANKIKSHAAGIRDASDEQKTAVSFPEAQSLQVCRPAPPTGYVQKHNACSRFIEQGMQKSDKICQVAGRSHNFIGNKGWLCEITRLQPLSLAAN